MSFFVQTRELSIRTRGKGTYELTRELLDFVVTSGVREGQLTVFVRHTSASLVIMENAAPEARTDLHAFFDHLVPETLPFLVHTDEGPDDSPSHLRMALTRTSEVIPVRQGQPVLGTWQGVFLFEHRSTPHLRQVVLSILGSNG
ncbi:MAG: secondary thiamine-phosphate synthase enzyme YjbQ [Verrucomicrobia bacterium]|jgi:secondary thiamine-phosphate synthase enzyme|nr:secondary thiamine-phosphate synthase enzyme YjbQ [Verrucomicrobiota bacterium]